MCSCQRQFILAFAWNQRVALIMFKRSRFMYFWAWHICGWSPFDAHDVISWTDLLLGLSRSSDLEISSQNGFSFLNRAEDDIKSRKNIGKAQTGLPFGKGCLVSRGNEMSRKFFVFSGSINTGIFYLIVLSLLTGWFEIFDFHFICYQFSNCFVVFFPQSSGCLLGERKFCLPTRDSDLSVWHKNYSHCWTCMERSRPWSRNSESSHAWFTRRIFTKIVLEAVLFKKVV